MNIVDLHDLNTVVVPWPTAPGGAPHTPAAAATTLTRHLDTVPAEQLLTAAATACRDEQVAEYLNLPDDAPITGEHVRRYLHAHVGIVTGAAAYAVADRWVGIVTTTASNDLDDAARILAETYDAWPAPTPTADTDLAERLMAVVEAAARAVGAAAPVRIARFDCTRDGDTIQVGCDEIEVDYTDGSTDGLHEAPGITTGPDSGLLALVPTTGEEELAVRLGRDDTGAAWIATDVRDVLL